MAQARVTDYFSQSKRTGGTRSRRSKAQDGRTGKAHDPAPLEEFLRVIDEAAAPDAKPLQPPSVPQQPQSPTVTFSPRTPKRPSAETEEPEAGPAALCSATELHSTAKKRQRLGAERDKRAGTAESKSARKKLQLTKNEEPEQIPAPVSPALQAPPPPVDKESKNLVNHNTTNPALSEACGPTSPKQSTRNKKTFSRGDVAALKSRLQKLKGQVESTTSPAAAPLSTLAELKARLDSAREISARAQQRKVERLAEEEKAGEEREQAKPKTEEGEKLPAYQRFHTLAQDVPPGLALSFKYKVLAEMFRGMDTIVGMLFNRSETVTFAKIKQGVQDLMHKRFEESHVGQIKTVFPSAYIFRQEKNIPTFSANVNKSSYQLTVEPVIHEETNGVRPMLSASRQLERRRIFHQNLVEIMKGHHKAFLASMNPPVDVPDEKITRWHPRFRVDEVPNIQPSDLPLPPQTAKLTTAQEVLDKARSLMTPKMEKALANMALKTAETACSKETEAQAKEPPTATPTPSALKGVSQSLLERIRAKEAQKLQAMMTRNPQQEERLAMMARLPEMTRILRNVFVAEKKPALVMETACNRMISSYRSALSSGEMEKHIRLLAELAPEWLTLHPIRKDFYLKLNKNMNLNLILEKLSQKIKEEERL